MRRRAITMSAAMLAATMAGCGRDGTTLEIEALGMPGATVSWAGVSATVDSSGAASLTVPDLHGDYEGCCGLTLVAYVDANSRPLVLEVTRDGRTERLTPACVPSPPVQGPPIDRLTLLVRREIATGHCALIGLETQQGDAVRRGEYTPERFDDAPCGSWQ